MKKIFICAMFLCIICFKGVESAAQAVDGNDDFTSALSGRKLLDDVSLIFDFSYTWRNLKDGDIEDLSVPGAIDISDNDISDNGFNLNYAELAIPARIDQYFNAFIDMRIDTEDITLHELYADSTDLPANLNLKFGRFLSSFGRLNRQHEHAQDFWDVPIVYEAMFSKEGLLESGVYLGWTVPVEFYFTLGCEVLQGENENSYGNEASPAGIEAADWPNLINFLVKNGFSTDSFDVEWGVSAGLGGARLDKSWTDSSGWAFEGDTMLMAVDLLIRYNFDAYRNIVFQGEYMYRSMEGDKFSGSTIYENVERKLSGFYVQLIGRPFIHWRFGARLESILTNEETNSNLSSDELHDMKDCFKASAMIDYLPTQHTRFRLQYNYNSYQYDGAGDLILNHEIVVQATTSIGSHGRFLQ